MIRRIQAETWLEVDTTGPTLSLVIETPAAEGDGDVEVYSLDITASVAGPENAEKRRKLRDAFAES